MSNNLHRRSALQHFRWLNKNNWRLKSLEFPCIDVSVVCHICFLLTVYPGLHRNFSYILNTLQPVGHGLCLDHLLSSQPGPDHFQRNPSAFPDRTSIRHKTRFICTTITLQLVQNEFSRSAQQWATRSAVVTHPVSKELTSEQILEEQRKDFWRITTDLNFPVMCKTLFC